MCAGSLEAKGCPVAPAARIAGGIVGSGSTVGPGGTVVGLDRSSADQIAGQRRARLQAEHAANAARTTLPTPTADAASLLLQLERELDRVADEMQEGPAQALAAARFAADTAALGGADVSAVRAAVGEALAAVRRAVWELRTPPAAGGLGDALADLAGRIDTGPGLVLQGRPGDLAVLEQVPAAIAVSAYRLVQAAMRAASSQVRIGVSAGVGVVELTVRGHALSAPDRADWAIRLTALGAHLVVDPSAMRLLLPTTDGHDPERLA